MTTKSLKGGKEIGEKYVFAGKKIHFDAGKHNLNRFWGRGERSGHGLGGDHLEKGKPGYI